MTRERIVVFGAAFAVVVLAHGPFLFRTVTRSPHGIWTFATFIVAALLLGDAATWTLGVIRERRRGAGSWMMPVAWLAWTALAVLLWREVIHPAAHPDRSLIFFATLAAVPAALVERGRGDPWLARSAERWRVVLIVLGLTAGIVQAIHYAVAARDTVEGVDFYYYVCFARDLASGANDVPVARYMYFPGVYLFWRSVLRVAGESLSALQWAYV